MQIVLYASETLDHYGNCLWPEFWWCLTCTVVHHVCSSDICGYSSGKAKPETKEMKQIQSGPWANINHLANGAGKKESIIPVDNDKGCWPEFLPGIGLSNFSGIVSLTWLNSTMLWALFLTVFTTWKLEPWWVLALTMPPHYQCVALVVEMLPSVPYICAVRGAWVSNGNVGSVTHQPTGKAHVIVVLGCSIHLETYRSGFLIRLHFSPINVFLTPKQGFYK